MLGLAHLGMIFGFIVVGALGMAAMQDGLAIVWRHRPWRRARSQNRPVLDHEAPSAPRPAGLTFSR